MRDKRFIEVGFPVKEVGEESVRDKNIRHGHISTLHIWWARRPLASSRATNYAALIPVPETKKAWNEKKKFIIDLSKWDNSLNKNIIGKAKRDILEAYGGKPPRVLDPFAGGGAIPLEALRLGCETYAGEYNPVAVLILKCTLEYPQKYGKPFKIKEMPSSLFPDSETQKTLDFESKVIPNRLFYDVKRWGKWILGEAKREIEKFYPNEEDSSIPVGYIWARTIPCQNPSCKAEIPLMRQFWLAKKDKKKIALKPFVKKSKVEFEIVGQDNPFPEDFDPSKGTVKRAVANCLVCGYTVDARTVRKLFQEGKSPQTMVAVVQHHPESKGKTYRRAKEKDMEIFKEAENYLEEKRNELFDKWGVDPVPDEEIPLMSGTFNVPLYGLNRWGDLFNSRQKLALITFVEKVREAYKKMLEEDHDEEYAKALLSYLGLNLDRLASYCSSLGYWHVSGEKMSPAMQRQALAMVFDYAESNPFAESFSWDTNLDWILRIIDHCSQIARISNSESSMPTITQYSATSLHYPDNFFDAVFTDPPYYNSVPYADLCDFFYVWLKRSIGDLYPDLFSTPLSPKTKEIVEMASWDPERYAHKDKAFFEKDLKKSFQEIYRVLKPDGIATIVYTHKSASGWETVINSLLDSGLLITASWPIHTEMMARLRAKESAALASSIYFVARKAERIETGWLNEVKEEIKKYIYQKLERLWQEGISGADFFIAGIGSAIEIFGKYKKVIDYENNIIRTDKLLYFVRKVVKDYTIRQILHDGIAGELSPLTEFYLYWRFNYQEKRLHFDDARKLAQSTGFDLAYEWNKGFIKKEKEFIRILGPQDRDVKEIEGSSELIDILHQVLILWKEGKREDMASVLHESGWGTKDAFYRVAQAISETLSPESKEKKLLDGFLSGKEKIVRDVSEVKDKKEQERLFE